MILLVRRSLLQPSYTFSYEWEAFLQFIRGHLSFHASSLHSTTATSVKCITAADSHNNNNNKNISFVLLYALLPHPPSTSCSSSSTRAFSFPPGQRRVRKIHRHSNFPCAQQFYYGHYYSR